MKRSFNRSLRRFSREWVCPILIALLLATSFKSAIADWNIVPTGSMKPTIVEGDRIFVNKLAYDLKLPYTTRHLAQWKDPQRGDIVVFYSPADEERLVKRVVGLPGDSIAMGNNRLYINGIPLDYAMMPKLPGYTGREQAELTEYLGTRQHPILLSPNIPSPRSFAPLTVPKDSYFMLGDNRDNSADSRYFGCVERHRIVGRATAVVASLDSSNLYAPRWERFFTALP